MGSRLAWRFGLVLAAATATTAGCVGEGGSWTDELPAVDDLPWPTPEALPPCTPVSSDFALPALAAPGGRLQVVDPLRVYPTGVVTTIDLVALDAGGSHDATVSGDVQLDLGGGGDVLEVAPMVGGEAAARVRFTAAGTFTVTATHTQGGQSGTSEVATYATRLPVWELTIDPAHLDAMEADPFDDLKVPATVTIDGTALATTVRLHGGTSRDFPKKSFRFDLGAGLDLDGANHLILRAEWADKTLVRNWLAFELLRAGTWLPASGTELVHFRINERFYGVMNHVERIDRDFLRARGMSANGSMYEADPPREAAPGDLTPLPPEQYPITYQLRAGANGYDDLRRLVEEVLRRPPGDFEATLTDEIEVDDVLVYLAALAVIQNHDHVRKNYYLHRDPASPVGWRFLPWDLDLSFGHLYTEEDDVQDERIFVDGDPFVGQLDDGETGPFNQLIDRLLDLPELRARFLAMARRLATSVASDERIDEHLTWATCRAGMDLLTDDRKRATNAEYLGRLDEIRAFTSDRRAFLDALAE
ncbi:MAG: CotH kinase family protein [Deltaproteobacteria bacterium]|nr:CotH kinase family protein [Kofleriaceae bacterium]